MQYTHRKGGRFGRWKIQNRGGRDGFLTPTHVTRHTAGRAYHNSSGLIYGGRDAGVGSPRCAGIAQAGRRVS